MNCNDARAEIAALAWGELEGAARAGLEEHLATCDECRRFRDDTRAVLPRLDAWTDATPGDDVPAFMPPRPTKAARRRRLAPLLRGAAAAAVVFALLSWVGARVETGGGSLTITFGGTSPTEAAPGGVSDLELARAVRREARLAHATAANAIDGAFAGLEERNTNELAQLIRHFEKQRREDLVAIGLVLREMNESMQKEWRDALRDTVTWVRTVSTDDKDW